MTPKVKDESGPQVSISHHTKHCAGQDGDDYLRGPQVSESFALPGIPGKALYHRFLEGSGFKEIPQCDDIPMEMLHVNCKGTEDDALRRIRLTFQALNEPPRPFVVFFLLKRSNKLLKKTNFTELMSEVQKIFGSEAHNDFNFDFGLADGTVAAFRFIVRGNAMVKCMDQLSSYNAAFSDLASELLSVWGGKVTVRTICIETHIALPHLLVVMWFADFKVTHSLCISCH